MGNSNLNMKIRNNEETIFLFFNSISYSISNIFSLQICRDYVCRDYIPYFQNGGVAKSHIKTVQQS